MHRRARNAADHLADEEAVGDAVVAVTRAGLVTRRLPRELRADEVPVEHLVRARDHVAQRVQPGGVAQEMPHGDELLAALREFRPVRRDRLVVVDEPAVDEPVDSGGDDALRRREAHGHRVRLPGRSRGVARSGPGVDHELAAVVHGYRRAAAAFVRGNGPERLGDAAEVGMDES